MAWPPPTQPPCCPPWRLWKHRGSLLPGCLSFPKFKLSPQIRAAPAPSACPWSGTWQAHVHSEPGCLQDVRSGPHRGFPALPLSRLGLARSLLGGLFCAPEDVEQHLWPPWLLSGHWLLATWASIGLLDVAACFLQSNRSESHSAFWDLASEGRTITSVIFHWSPRPPLTRHERGRAHRVLYHFGVWLPHPSKPHPSAPTLPGNPPGTQNHWIPGSPCTPLHLRIHCSLCLEGSALTFPPSQGPPTFKGSDNDLLSRKPPLTFTGQVRDLSFAYHCHGN